MSSPGSPSAPSTIAGMSNESSANSNQNSASSRNTWWKNVDNLQRRLATTNRNAQLRSPNTRELVASLLNRGARKLQTLQNPRKRKKASAIMAALAALVPKQNAPPPSQNAAGGPGSQMFHGRYPTHAEFITTYAPMAQTGDIVGLLNYDLASNQPSSSLSKSNAQNRAKFLLQHVDALQGRTMSSTNKIKLSDIKKTLQTVQQFLRSTNATNRQSIAAAWARQQRAQVTLSGPSGAARPSGSNGRGSSTASPAVMQANQNNSQTVSANSPSSAAGSTRGNNQLEVERPRQAESEGKRRRKRKTQSQGNRGQHAQPPQTAAAVNGAFNYRLAHMTNARIGGLTGCVRIEGKRAYIGNVELMNVVAKGSKSLVYRARVPAQDGMPEKALIVKFVADTPAHTKEANLLAELSKLVYEGKFPNFSTIYAIRKCIQPCPLVQCPKGPYIVVMTEMHGKNSERTLKDWLRTTHTNREYGSAMAQMLLALAKLHSLGKSHNDIHWGHFLMHRVPYTGGYFWYKVQGKDIFVPNTGFIMVLWDFGLADTISKPHDDIIHVLASFITKSHPFGLAGKNGTAPASAPIQRAAEELLMYEQQVKIDAASLMSTDAVLHMLGQFGITRQPDGAVLNQNKPFIISMAKAVTGQGNVKLERRNKYPQRNPNTNTAIAATRGGGYRSDPRALWRNVDLSTQDWKNAMKTSGKWARILFPYIGRRRPAP